MRSILLAVVFLGMINGSHGQSCTLQISGTIKDEFTQGPLEFATVLVEETGAGDVADATGMFRLTGLCAGAYHLRISHLGCHPERIFIDLQRDTSLTIELEHHAEFLERVVVEGQAEGPSTTTSNVIAEEELHRQGGKTLGEIVQLVSGVSLIKNGSGISKPVIHGLYGNRINILNNGVVQAGQRWGNDHAPEVDPFAANRLSVVKGVDAIPYGGNSLGGAVLIEPGPIPHDPHLHGAVHYNLASNGRIHTLSSRLEKSGGWLDWRVTGTFKQGGDRRTPDYWLRNTGLRERNLAVQLAKSDGDKWFHQVYYSYFQTSLGILRGSHIGNLTDLEQAIGREEPFFTQEQFTYTLDAPRQEVQHHLLKATSKYYLSDKQSIHFTYAGQLNHRQEYDVRRGGRTDRPALDMQLLSHFVEVKWQQNQSDRHRWQGGLQYRFGDNENDADTGILPLIPDYAQHNIGAFLTSYWNRGYWSFELGGRYDYLQLLAKTITRDLPLRIERFTHNFHNAAVATGISFQNGLPWQAKFNLGFTQRSPEVNELYSFGLHQGVSGIEEGDPDLNTERALKAILTPTLTLSDRLLIEASAYYQWIDNYIFLEPQEEAVLTIRGAFPLFRYRQTNATVAGFDLLATFEPLDGLEWTGKYAIVRGRDRSQDQPLVYMPADNLYSSLSYHWSGSDRISEPRLTIAGQYVWEQTRLLPEQDFLAPPPAYFLLQASLEAKWRFADSFIFCSVQVDNLLNTRYRDYLNRLRYYADEEGRNVRVSLRYEF